MLVGVGTVDRDDPSLTVRRVPTRRPQPLRVVLDRTLRTPLGSKLVTDGAAPTLLVAGDDAGAAATAAALRGAPGVSVATLPGSYPEIADVLSLLHDEHGVRELMVEGGPGVIHRFLRDRLVDRAIVVRAPDVTFAGDPVPSDIDEAVLREAGLVKLGEAVWGDDEVAYYARPEAAWPGKDLSEWP